MQFERKEAAVLLSELIRLNLALPTVVNLREVRLRFAPQDDSSYSFDPTVGPGYVWHCHILDHENNEMMRPYIVLAPSSNISLLRHFIGRCNYCCYCDWNCCNCKDVSHQIKAEC